MVIARLKVLCCKLKLQRLARTILLPKPANFSSLTKEMKETMQVLRREKEREGISVPQAAELKQMVRSAGVGDNHEDVTTNHEPRLL